MSKDKTKPGVVYAVVDARDPQRVRYIGRTVQPLKDRELKHWSDSRTKSTAFPNWLRSRSDRKEDVQFYKLSSHPNVEELNQAERDAIKKYRSVGQADLNLTDGGDGGLTGAWDDARRKKHLESVQRGEDRFNSRLTWEDVRTIRSQACDKGVNASEIAEQKNLSQATVNDMLRNETWYDPNYDPKLRVKNRKGELAGNVKLTRTQVEEIRDQRKTAYAPDRVTAEQYGVSQDMIRRILMNQNWKDPEFNPGDIIKRGTRS